MCVFCEDDYLILLAELRLRRSSLQGSRSSAHGGEYLPPFPPAIDVSIHGEHQAFYNPGPHGGIEVGAILVPRPNGTNETLAHGACT